MTATENICPFCGKPVQTTALQGICPECMLKAGLVETGEVGPDGTVVGKPLPQPVPGIEEIAPHFPQLEILECLGRGGMGAVYKARQPKLDRFVALKILTRRQANGITDTEFAARFQQEARALARLNHPDIVAVYDFGEVIPATSGSDPATGTVAGTLAGGTPAPVHYLLMEFVDGLTLRQLLQSKRIAPEEALAIVPKICEALQFAHERGIVHRDIKPENILLDKQGRVKIADFGIAKILGATTAGASLTGAKDVIGTPHYMAPEQIEKPTKVDHRADIYSLGVVFYEMLTGELPLGKFQSPSKKVQVDVRLDEVVLHALEKEPDRRYQHASEVKTDVETIATTPGSAGVPLARVDARTTGTATNKSPLVRILEILFGITFTSPLACKLINVSALGFLASLAFLGYVPLPGWHRCFGFSGFAGFFGLIGVASMIEFAKRRKGRPTMTKAGSMTSQAAVNEAEWKNPRNWSGPKWLSLYFSKRDSRVWVPKQIPALGWTVNLGSRKGAAWLLGIFFSLIGILAAALVLVSAPGYDTLTTDLSPRGLGERNASRDFQLQPVAGSTMEPRVPPVVIQTFPESGAANVDPALTELRVTFSKLMRDGSWSWTIWGEENFPETTGSARYLADGRTCVLPVKLKPGKLYALWLNSEYHHDFKDREGQSAVPYVLIFETRK